ncbi:MAG: fliA 2 [Acidobacteria bacterium]|nr:fliA 2 [Acidobacteriota bacterium]
MQVHPLPATESRRVVAGLPFVEALARRVASSMPHSIDIGDLVQDGVLGLIDAAQRYDASRGIKFETFAERRVRGAMIDALRREAWPRGVRRQRRELEAARESLRRELGHEPSVADLAARVGSDEKRLNRTILRITTIESTSPLSAGDHHHDDAARPAVLVPSEPESPDAALERTEVQDRVRAAIATLPARERKLIGLYYFGDVTMKEIGTELGVNESRVSQLHARAIQRLRQVLEPVQRPVSQPPILTVLTPRPRMVARPVLPFEPRPVAAKASLPARREVVEAMAAAATVLPYASTSRTVRSRSASLKGLASQRQPLSSRKRSASAPTTSPVQKITRRASAGLPVAIAR